MKRENYKVIAIIGSMRYFDEHNALVERLFLTGHVPIALIRTKGPNKKGPRGYSDEEVKEIADAHIRKVIDISDCVFVVNKNRYMGTSTLGEVHYAVKSGKPVVCMEAPISPDTWQVRCTVTSNNIITIDDAILTAKSPEDAMKQYTEMQGYDRKSTNYDIDVERPGDEIIHMMYHVHGPSSHIYKDIMQQYDDQEESKFVEPERNITKQFAMMSSEDYLAAIKQTIPNIITQNIPYQSDIYNKLVAIQHILSI